MRMPLAQLAYVEPVKVTGYLLSEDHRHGRSKAAFFRRFGFMPSRPEVLIAALRRHAVERDVAERHQTPYGVRYELRCSIASPDGRDPCIVSVWQMDEAGLPRLVTAYPAG
jgi:hypothetical protein